ncbi:WecB/TagA/CpsF family glycosyltransferase [Planococcus shenhongbingii]|uniref:WecB/TagA/CpsF family glycosyltransferase n=1 Tax=Planococcus shenhongbingii TaxID=3058398 RepID=A0ABT8N9R2_9BACL|nr:WecB/TagA/CpsF family glycosyltransferase [Planococcus sp. N017]MDN7244632.1 WecB/TagA/CpsF family glycosyltransferase [Planococcus sp. N017]
MNQLHYKKMGNIKLLDMDKSLLLDDIRHRLLKNIKTRIFFINAHCFNIAQTDEEYRRQVNEAELVLNDGIGVKVGAALFDIQVKENLNGTDFTPHVLQLINNLNMKLYLLGGKPGVAQKAGERIQKDFPNINIVGYSDGYFRNSEKKIEEINRLQPDLVLVGLGVPLQENWISKNFEKLDAQVVMGIGAFLDFASGTVKRAPKVIQGLRMEWMFRLLLEPKRMWKRYLIGNVLFFIHVLRQSKFGRKAKKVL